MQCVVIGALMSALVLSDQKNALQSPVSTITVAKNEIKAGVPHT